MPIELEMVLRLMLATVLGAIIGLQRYMVRKPAGIRDHSLISLGSALFTVVSSLGFADGDPTRIASGIVAGIGFIGAGAILRSPEGAVAGITTAASIWVAAGIGLAAGAGMYIIAPVATAITLMILVMPHRQKNLK